MWYFAVATGLFKTNCKLRNGEANVNIFHSPDICDISTFRRLVQTILRVAKGPAY